MARIQERARWMGMAGQKRRGRREDGLPGERLGTRRERLAGLSLRARGELMG
jgi:hypothetical protein